MCEENLNKINDINNSKVVNIEELKIIMEWTDKAFFNEEKVEKRFYKIEY